MFWSCSGKRFKACNDKKNKKRKKNRLIPIGILIIATALFSAWQFDRIIHPNLEYVSQAKAKEMVSAAVNEATCTQFFKEASKIEELLIINTDNEGSIELVQSNAVAMNILAAELEKEIKTLYKNMEPARFEVPLGTLLGSQLMSQADIYVNLKVLPQSVVNVEFFSEFESKGINQTKYKVYLSLTSKVRVNAPFSSETLEIQNTVLVAEAVILGKVPNSYVNVPKDGILDGMDSGE